MKIPALLILLATLPASAATDAFGDHPGFAHAMDVRTECIDDFPVVFHYAQGLCSPAGKPKLVRDIFRDLSSKSVTLLT